MVRGILGHAREEVVEAVQKAAIDGLTLWRPDKERNDDRGNDPGNDAVDGSDAPCKLRNRGGDVCDSVQQEDIPEGIRS